MTWLSINPFCENYFTVSAAYALASTSTENRFVPIDRKEIDPVHLANLYNNAEALGLDLLSVKTREPDKADQTALYEEHEHFFSELIEAALRDIEREDSTWTLTKDLLWSYNLWTKSYYDG